MGAEEVMSDGLVRRIKDVVRHASEWERTRVREGRSGIFLRVICRLKRKRDLPGRKSGKDSSAKIWKRLRIYVHSSLW
jgi:hypothetical protein